MAEGANSTSEKMKESIAFSRFDWWFVCEYVCFGESLPVLEVTFILENQRNLSQLVIQTHSPPIQIFIATSTAI